MTKKKQTENKTCWVYKLFKISTCGYADTVAEGSYICKDNKYGCKEASRLIDDVVTTLGDFTAEEIVSALNSLDMGTRRKIIVGLKLSVNPLEVNYGQVVKYIYNGEERFGCLIGGGQKLKLCVIDSDLNRYVKIDRYDILDTLPDRLHVKKQGKYRWPIKKHHNEDHYKDNQKKIQKYLMESS
jgi:hypothetical protein